MFEHLVGLLLKRLIILFRNSLINFYPMFQSAETRCFNIAFICLLQLWLDDVVDIRVLTQSNIEDGAFCENS